MNYMHRTRSRDQIELQAILWGNKIRYQKSDLTIPTFFFFENDHPNGLTLYGIGNEGEVNRGSKERAPVVEGADWQVQQITVVPFSKSITPRFYRTKVAKVKCYPFL